MIAQAIDLWFHLIALWTPPPLQPLVQDMHRSARQTSGHPLHRRR